MASQHIVPLPPEVKKPRTPTKEAAPSKSAVEMRYGFRTLYLGSIPTTDITSTETSVSLLLDRFRLGSINDEDIFLDTKICGLIMYFVDNKDKIVKTKIFDLSRISFCSGDHVIDPCVFAWVYHQETRDGFRHECHAVKASSEKKARYLAVLLNNAFTQLYHEVQAALSSSRLFHQARCDKNRNIKELPKVQDVAIVHSSDGDAGDNAGPSKAVKDVTNVENTEATNTLPPANSELDVTNNEIKETHRTDSENESATNEQDKSQEIKDTERVSVTESEEQNQDNLEDDQDDVPENFSKVCGKSTELQISSLTVPDKAQVEEKLDNVESDSSSDENVFDEKEEDIKCDNNIDNADGHGDSSNTIDNDNVDSPGDADLVAKVLNEHVEIND